MKFVCDRCQTRYSIADDKVRGKILKVRCKSCQNVITVREASLAGAEAAGPQVNEERTVMAPAPTAAEPFAQPASRSSGVMPAVRGAAPPPAPPARDRDDVQWYMALDGNRTGPFSRKLLIDKLAALPADADLHIWNEKLDGWKEPGDVPVIARDLQARRRPPVPPMPGAGLHTGPHAVPGAARRTTTGSQPVVIPAAAAAAPVSPRKTAHSLPAPSGAVGAAAAPAHAPAAGGATPRGRKSVNGVALNGSGDHGPALVSEDAAPALGMPGEEPWSEGEPPAGDVPVVPPEGAATAGTDVVRPANWQAGSVPVVTTQPRHRSAKLMLASLGIVAVIVVLVTFSFLNKKPPPAPVEPPKTAVPADNSFAQLADKLAQQGAENPPAVEAIKPEASKTETTTTVRPTAPVKGGKQLKGKNKKGLGRGGALSPTSPPPVGATSAPVTSSEPPPPTTFMGGERQVQQHAGGGAKSAPTQGDITRVINNNKNGIKICYQRALLKDSSLTHGKINVHVTVGLSGKVKNTGIDGPTSFLTLQPCIKDLVSRWAFPPSSEAYETEFSYVFQGNE